MTSANKEPKDNHAAFRDLAMRLLPYRRVDESETTEELKLIVGKLPDELPVEVPILENSQIIGSMVNFDKSVTVIFDTEQQEEQVIDFYRQYLLSEGWQEDDNFDRGGFDNNFNKIFYLGARGPGINIFTYKTSDRVTEVRLYIHPKSRDRRYGDSRFNYRGDKLIPNLVAPPNSYQQLKGGGGNDDNYRSTAMLKTDLDLSAVADHYIRQLEQAWTSIDRGQSSTVAWSTWTFADKDEDEDEENRWQGFFFVYKNTVAPRQYFLLLQTNLVM